MSGSIQGNQGFIPPEAPRAQPPMLKPVRPPRDTFTRDITKHLQGIPTAPKRWNPDQFRSPLTVAEQTALNALNAAMPMPRSAETETKIETKTPSAPPPLSIPTALKTRNLEIVPPLPPSQRSSQIGRSSAASQKALTSSATQLKKTNYQTGALRPNTKSAIGGHRKLPTPNYGIFFPFPGMEGQVKTASLTPAVKEAQNSVVSSIINFAIKWGRKLFS